MKFVKEVVASIVASFVAVNAGATASTTATDSIRSPVSQQRKLGIINTVDTSETYFAEDAQAWRYLGTYIDCGEHDDDYNNNNDNDDEDGNDNDNDYNNICQRYLLWAAYVDKGYTGDTDGAQYMFYNEVTEKWDDSSCDLLNGDDSRCVAMDCHLPNTHWSLIGYYKEAGVSDFLKQLSYHQGSCQWTSEESQFVESSRRVFPNGCTMSSLKDPENVDYLYYDVKPGWPSRMSIGLYTDDACSEPYVGDYYTVEDVLQSEMENNNGNDDGNFDNSIAYGSQEWTDNWNKALNKYKKCQPCKASLFGNNDYLLEAKEERRVRHRHLDEDEDEDGQQEDNDGEDEQDQNEDEDEDEDQQQEDDGQDGENEGDGGALSCKDAKGKYGVNQCAYFAQNTNMSPATWKDLRLATLQGTIAPVHVTPRVTSTPLQSWWRAWGFFTVSLITLLIGLILFCTCVKVKKRFGDDDSNDRSRPLLFGRRNTSNSNNRRNSRR